MIKLNDDSIIIGQIKQILKDFNLPRCKINPDISNGYEIYNNSYIIENDRIYFIKEGQKQEVSSYIENDKYLNITTNLDITSKYYDIKTHKYLGDYLRFIRDYKKVNLMSMYNCNINKISNKDILIEDNGNIIDWPIDKYDIYIIPVKLNKDYTIALCSDAEVCYCLYNDENNDFINIDKNKELPLKTRRSFYCKDVSNPYLYNKDVFSEIEDLKFVYDYEKVLSILIKVPKGYNKSIIVLEGNFTTTCNNKNLQDNNSNVQIAINPKNNNWKDYNINQYITNPQLLSLENFSKNYLLADRLIEYLTGNVICPLSESYDIEKLQKWIQYNLEYNKEIQSKLLLDNTFPGIWSLEITYTLIQLYYKYCEDKTSAYYDFIGYCDSIMEKYLEELGVKQENNYGGIV